MGYFTLHLLLLFSKIHVLILYLFLKDFNGSVQNILSPLILLFPTIQVHKILISMFQDKNFNIHIYKQTYILLVFELYS